VLLACLRSRIDEPPASSRPSDNFTDFTFARSFFDFDIHASTVIWSPIFKVFRFHPARVSAFGLPISSVHVFIWPFWSFASMYNMACGFVHSTLLTVPVRVTGLVQSYSAAKG